MRPTNRSTYAVSFYVSETMLDLVVVIVDRTFMYAYACVTKSLFGSCISFSVISCTWWAKLAHHTRGRNSDKY